MIKNTKYIYFEHHFSDMHKKDYKFNDIHKYLVKNNFNKVFKIKMMFRKKLLNIYIVINIYEKFNLINTH